MFERVSRGAEYRLRPAPVGRRVTYNIVLLFRNASVITLRVTRDEDHCYRYCALCASIATVIRSRVLVTFIDRVPTRCLGARTGPREPTDAVINNNDKQTLSNGYDRFQFR
jgi:hypothetical protein